MSKQVILSLLNCASNGNELLSILDSLIEETDNAQGEEVSPFV
jgi:hypothetical protein